MPRFTRGRASLRHHCVRDERERERPVVCAQRVLAGVIKHNCHVNTSPRFYLALSSNNWYTKNIVIVLIMKLQPVIRSSSLITLDPGSGRKIPVNCMVPAYGVAFLPQNPSPGNGKIPAVISFLAWRADLVLQRVPHELILCSRIEVRPLES